MTGDFLEFAVTVLLIVHLQAERKIAVLKGLRLFAVLIVLLLGVGLTFVPRSIVHAADYSNTYWWSGGSNCNGLSTALLTWNGLQVCGPGSTGKYVIFPDGASVEEWQCVELVDRYLFLAFGASALASTDGYQIVDHYSTHYPSLFRKVPNTGTAKALPKVGDVLSYNHHVSGGIDDGGHTAIITAFGADPHNPSYDVATIIEENASSTGTSSQEFNPSTMEFLYGIDNNQSDTHHLVLSWLTPRVWGYVKSPTPSTINTNLYAVTSTSSKDVWAVGFYYSSSGHDLPFAIHWNGSSWGSNTISGYTSDLVLQGVSAISSSNVLAVGGGDTGTVALNYTTSWAPVPSDTPGNTASFHAVGNDRSGDAWAVGGAFSSDGGHILIEQYGGSLTGFQNWTLTGLDTTHKAVIPNLPGTTSNLLNAVTVNSSTDAWAVGYYADSNGYAQPLTYHYNGSTWTNETASIPSGTSGATLTGVTEVSANNVWAVGYAFNSYGNSYTYTIHWDGSQWSIISIPDPGTYNSVYAYNDLYAVTSVSDTATGNQQGYLVYAVGETVNSSGLFNTFVLVYGSSAEPSCSTPDLCSPGGGVAGKYGWLQEPSPNVGSSNNNHLDGVTITSSGDTGEVWAVGWLNNNSSSGFATLTERSK